jgi:hypothetical protein
VQGGEQVVRLIENLRENGITVPPALEAIEQELINMSLKGLEVSGRFTEMGDTFALVLPGMADVAEEDTQRMQAAFQSFGLQTQAQMSTTLTQMQQDFATVAGSGVASAAQIEAAWKQLEEFRQMASGETTQVYMTQSEALVSGAGQIFSALGTKYKAAAIAGAVIATYQAVAKALASAPWPANLILAAGALASGMVNVAKIKSSEAGFAEGTPNLDFLNFGAATPTMLHGNEAVIPQGGGHELASEIATSLAGKTSNVNVTFNVKVQGSDEQAAHKIGLLLERNKAGLRSRTRKALGV